MILQTKNNKGSGIAVVIYGVVLILVLIFTAINILNAKVIENGYNSLRDAVLAASSGSVIHLLTTETGGTESQNTLIGGAYKKDVNTSEEFKYDVYLQLALGYIINRTESVGSATAVQGAEINNFIKLDHKKVVESTMTLLSDAVIRNRTPNTSIIDTDKYKILMFFIEPRYSKNNYEKYFDIIMYTNADFDKNCNLIGNGHIDFAGADTARESMDAVYKNIQSRINDLVNFNPDSRLNFKDGNNSFSIDLNPTNDSLPDLVRKMETMPYYIIVVKDFALPTLFDGEETNPGAVIIKSAFTELSGDGKLSTPMCALNSGKTERKIAKEKK